MQAPDFVGILDDAAIFPPGELPLAEAVDAHAEHRDAKYADLVGAFVVRGSDIPAVTAAAARAQRPVDLLVTTPLTEVDDVVRAVEAAPALKLVGLEVTVGDGVDAATVIADLRSADLSGVPVVVEIPRDGRRPALIAALAGTPFGAKLRTGGVRAELYPDEAELADAIVALVAARVPFKATAGLHHAVRNTDPETGFEQHGFLNVLVATGAALDGASPSEVRDVLAQRDADAVVAAVRGVNPAARDLFRSFGTCSIDEPVDELVDLGLLPEQWRVA